jgi:crotonobetainyl-CoA:carnitine CoA-transferase CaiB-like acyl-CoA transferase
VFSQEPAQHWLDVLEAAAVPSAPISFLSEVVADPHFRARGAFTTLELEGGTDVQVINSPWRIVDDVQPRHQAPPGLGCDTAAVLTAAGMSHEDIDRLEAEGAIWRPEGS